VEPGFSSSASPCSTAGNSPYGAKLQQKIGYPPNGVSPLGVEEFPIFLDEDLMILETVLIGAGETGVEIEIAPVDLQLLTKAIVIKFSV
jgi:Cys-tRNA(Pro)/Cys-tRNA(Cys) deacylase